MKRALISVLILLFSLSLVSIVEAASYPVWSANSSGAETNVSYSNGTVYVNSVTIGPGGSGVSVYIVNDNNSWVNQTVLQGVIDSKNITLSAVGHIPLTELWSSPLTAGSYDIVVDVNQNGIYDAGNCGSDPWPDCVDDLTVTGFQVLQSIGSASAALGNKDVGSHGSYYNASGLNYNVMSQIKITASAIENITVASLALQSFGDGNDNYIVRVNLAVDANSNGAYDNGTDSILTNGIYPTDNGALTLTIPSGYKIVKGEAAYFLIVYEMSNLTAINNTFQFNLTGISATGVSSGGAIAVSGLPITSGTKTIIPEPTTSTTTSTTTTVGPTTTINVTTTTRKTTSTIQTTAVTTIPTTTTTIPAKPKPKLSDILLWAVIIIIIAAAATLGYLFYIKKKVPFKYSYKKHFPFPL